MRFVTESEKRKIREEKYLVMTTTWEDDSTNDQIFDADKLKNVEPKVGTKLSIGPMKGKITKIRKATATEITAFKKALGESTVWAGMSKNLKESSNLPAIAQAAGVAVNPKITQVVRQDTIYSTVQAMGIPVKVNAMKNVVAEVPDMPTAGAVLQKIYQAFGIKGSFMVTWEGKGKLYWDPKTPVDKASALAYAKQAGLPPPNFTKMLT